MVGIDAWIGYVYVQSCFLIIFQHQPMSLQYSWLSVEQPIRIDQLLYKHHWEFPIHEQIIPMLTYPIPIFYSLRWDRACVRKDNIPTQTSSLYIILWHVVPSVSAASWDSAGRWLVCSGRWLVVGSGGIDSYRGEYCYWDEETITASDWRSGEFTLCLQVSDSQLTSPADQSMWVENFFINWST